MIRCRPRSWRLPFALVATLGLNLLFAAQPVEAIDSTGFTPLIDMGGATYLGFGGGLYEDGTNSVPADHAFVGMAQAALVAPLDANGVPSPAGKIVLLSVGMSNTTQEFCSAGSAMPCDPWTFMGQAAAAADVNHASLTIVNGAAGGQAAATWDSPTDANYDRVRDTRLIPAGVTEGQVQAVWVKVANPNPTSPLPSAGADAYVLENRMGGIARALKVRYPNVRMVFFSSRVYGGHATTSLNPEPYAYESGLAVKWLIQAQIDQTRTGSIVDPIGGDLNFNTVAPWIAWGPYLWADGTSARSDGLTWQIADFSIDGTHPSMSGREKVGSMLMDFFRESEFTHCWFTTSCTDTDEDGIADAADNCPVIGNASQTDGDADALGDACETSYGTNAANPDSDGDGCADGREPRVLTYTPQQGGDRDPASPWDFFDVPVPALTASNPSGTKNEVVTLADALAVVYYVGTADNAGANANGVDYDADLNVNGVEDGREYDRIASVVAGKPWRSGAPNGAVQLADALVAVNQAGHNCTGTP